LTQQDKVVFSRREATDEQDPTPVFQRVSSFKSLREVAAGKTLAQAAREHAVHPNLIGKWRQQLESHGDKAFAGNGPGLHSGSQDRRVGAPDRPTDDRERVLKKVLVPLGSQASPVDK